ncbi:MAG TPA: TldD/PmbA family protein [Ignavibacteriales bacterium]|nr:TldD/PmbA family protein [Ignavibacteriales bacterium]
MLLDEHKKLAQEVIDLVKKQGGDTAVVRISYGTDKEVSVRNQKIDTLTQSNSKMLSLTVSKDKKKAVVSTSDFSEEALKNLVKDAMKIVKYTGADEFYGLPEKSELGMAEADLKMYDPNEESVTIEKRIEMAKELESLSLKYDKDLIADGASVSSSSGHFVLANSLGFCEGYRQSDCGMQSSCAIPDAVEGLNSARKQSGGWYTAANRFDQLDPVESVAEKAAKRTIMKRGARKPKTQTVPVIFENTVARGLLSFLVQAITGGNIYTKQSFLTDKLGQKIAGENVTIVEDPLIAGQVSSRPFDGEGVKSKRKVVVEKGVLKTFLLDSYSARKLSMKTTGNADGVSNLYLESGKSSLEDMIKTIDNGVLITYTSGFGEILQTGDYSRGAQGLWIENGKIAYPVNEFTIASTMSDILNNIEIIGNDPIKTGSVYCPSIKVKKMTISGV